jgi:ubiquinol-cytochrome c reductase iron-sulfur subunit
VAHATDTTGTEPTRRDFLMLTTGAFGAIGAAAVVVPLVSQLAPDAQTVAAGAPIDLDLAPIAEGQAI